MAEQDGIFKIKGTLGGVTFYKTRDGYLAREKGGVSKKRIASDPAFKRTRENGQEFGTAARYGKHLRNAIRYLLQHSADNRVVSRLHKELMHILKTDEVNSRGLRTPLNGELSLLNGFEFNSRGLLTTTLYVPFESVLDRTSGTLSVTLPDIIPSQMIKAPEGTTHFKMVSAAAEIDFVHGDSALVTDSTPEIPYDETLLPGVTLNTAVTAASTLPLMQVLGVEFYQQINGLFYMLNNGAFNALAIINIEKP